MFDATPGVTWSVLVERVAPDRERLLAHDPDRIVPTASVGKVLLLLEVARRLDGGTLRPGEVVERRPGDAVADSGLWQHLSVDRLTITDLATLVGAVSDNLATNVLLRRVGLRTVRALAGSLGLMATELHDRVRDSRRPDDPPWLSTGSARELAGLMRALHSGTAVSAAASAQVLAWLGLGVDLSLVASAFGLDPLSHGGGEDRGLVVVNKTGTDPGVRADVGVVTLGPDAAVAYAALARWSPDGPDHRDAVLATMRSIGAEIRSSLA